MRWWDIVNICKRVQARTKIVPFIALLHCKFANKIIINNKFRLFTGFMDPLTNTGVQCRTIVMFIRYVAYLKNMQGSQANVLIII